MKFLSFKSDFLFNKITFIIFFFTSSLLVACGGGGGGTTPPGPTVARIDLSPASLTLAKSGSQQFSAIARDAGGAAISGVAFQWSSSAPNIISIDSNGLASGAAEGAATISASANGVSGTVTIQVKAISTIQVSPATATISKTGSLQFNATAQAADGTALTGAAFAWSSSDPNVVGINASGLATGLLEGTAEVIAAADGIQGNATVHVTVRLFSSPTNYAAGQNPTAVAAGDFNNDHVVDLAVANADDNTISLLTGTGSGLFSAAQPFSVGTFPQSLVSERFNNDSFDDLAVANFGSNSISIFLGIANGIGPVAGLPATGNGPIAIIAADFNNDGKQDLATANLSTSDISLILGNGDGSFQAPLPFSAGGSGTIALLATDLNKDGLKDIVAVLGSDNKIAVLLNDGSGGFANPQTLSVGSAPNAVVSGDWDGDGNIDIAVINSGSADLTLLFGDGTGGFSAQTRTIPLGGHPEFAATGDFDHDGKPDIAVSNGDPQTPRVSILLNIGGGSFSEPIQQSTGNRPLGIIARDLNSDGKDDLVVTNAGDNTISVFLQSGP